MIIWAHERYSASSLEQASSKGSTHLSDDWLSLVAFPEIEIIIEATGNPIAAVEHCLTSFKNGEHVINVTVEADAMLWIWVITKGQPGSRLKVSASIT